MNRTRVLAPEVLPYASVVVIPAGATVCAWCPDWQPTVAGTSHGMCAACILKFEQAQPITVPERFRDLPLADGQRPCDVCGLRASFHYDGWDGNYLGCDEAANRHGGAARVQAAARTEAERAAFHLLLTHPATAARLDAMLADNERIDAQLREDDRLDAEREGDERGGCSSACGYCGSCS